MTKREALAEGNKLLRKMKPKGAWKLCVDEAHGEARTFGWYYCVSALDRHLTVWQSGKKYHCLLSDGTYRYTGCAFWKDEKFYRNPNIAWRETFKIAQRFVKSLTDHLFPIRQMVALTKWTGK